MSWIVGAEPNNDWNIEHRIIYCIRNEHLVLWPDYYAGFFTPKYMFMEKFFESHPHAFGEPANH